MVRLHACDEFIMADKINPWRQGPQVARNYKFLIMPPVHIECYGTFHRLDEPDRTGMSRYGWQFLLPMEKVVSDLDPSALHDYNTRFDMGRCDPSLTAELSTLQEKERVELLRRYRAMCVREGRDWDFA